MKKRFMTLDKKWKEILFSASGFGPNLLMVLMGAYFMDAVQPSALPEGSFKAISATGHIFVLVPFIFPFLWAIAKAFDGIVDVPLAHLTDSLKTKWGKRRPLILICFIPMVLAYACCWIPIAGTSLGGSVEVAQTINTIWIVFWAFVFFATYTLSLISFYGSISTVCYDDSQRLRVSSFKSFFDTISYCLVYALVPLILDGMQIHIDKFTLMLLPVMATMLIPLFLIKEGEKWEKKAIAEGYDIVPLAEEKPVSMKESIKLTFTNKPFLKWCVVNCCSFFGLQMFLVSMGSLIEGGMNLSGGQMAILNTCAFAPVPLMLYLFNKLRDRKGIRFAYQTCLISFAICILTFDIASCFVLGPENHLLKIIIGCIGGVIGSWAIGSFFMMPYMIPAQISSVEEKLTGKNHSAMYFAGQALTTSIIGAIASSIVWGNIKGIFIDHNFNITFADNFSQAALNLGFIQNIEQAMVDGKLADVVISNVFNLGTLLVPIFVSLFCVIGFIVSFKMPKHFSPKEVSHELGLDKEYEENKHLFPEENTKPYSDESIGVNIALFILSGGIFGFVWQYTIMNSIYSLSKYRFKVLHFILGALFFPYVGVTLFRLNKKLVKAAKEKGVKCVDLSVLHLILGLFGLNVISLIIMQRHLNKLHKVL